ALPRWRGCVTEPVVYRSARGCPAWPGREPTGPSTAGDDTSERRPGARTPPSPPGAGAVLVAPGRRPCGPARPGAGSARSCFAANATPGAPAPAGPRQPVDLAATAATAFWAARAIGSLS